MKQHYLKDGYLKFDLRGQHCLDRFAVGQQQNVCKQPKLNLTFERIRCYSTSIWCNGECGANFCYHNHSGEMTRSKEWPTLYIISNCSREHALKMPQSFYNVIWIQTKQLTDGGKMGIFQDGWD